jgi:hypothetical protein
LIFPSACYFGIPILWAGQLRYTTGRDPAVTVRLPSAVLGEAEAWATAHDISRSAAIRRLVELGLKAKGK